MVKGFLFILGAVIRIRGIEVDIKEILKSLCQISGQAFAPNYDKEDIQSDIEELIQDITEGLN